MSVLRGGLRVHIVGVGGAGMSGLARLLVEMGVVVSGSDVVDSVVLDELRNAGVLVTLGHDASNVASVDVVLWSPAIGPDNVELVSARRNGATFLSRAEVLSELSETRRVIGLTGTHGKTTATSMMVHVLRAASRDDARLVGADVLGVGANGHWGSDDLILEVDESYGTFSLLRPYALGLLNVEADHLDHYGTLRALEEAFAQLVTRTRGPVVVWSDDAGAQRVATLSGRHVARVGTTPEATWTVSRVSLARHTASFMLRGPDESFDIALAVTGAHNVANAAVVATLARALDVPVLDVVTGLANFQGAPRRFQLLGQWEGRDVYEDYAHLPGEIAATIVATRAAGYDAPAVVFQPHRFTRTLALASDFASAFDGADSVIVTDVYAAGESNPTGVTGEVVAKSIAERIGGPRVEYCASLRDVPAALAKVATTSDVVLLLGAGDVASVATSLPGGLH